MFEIRANPLIFFRHASVRLIEVNIQTVQNCVGTQRARCVEMRGSLNPRDLTGDSTFPWCRNVRSLPPDTAAALALVDGRFGRLGICFLLLRR